MRVLMYTDRPVGLGGIETHIASLVPPLIEAGCDVAVACRRIDDPRPFAPLLAAGVPVREASAEAVRAWVLSERFDLVHAHSAGAARLAYALHRELGIPVVATVHGPEQRLPLAPGPGVGVICVSGETAAPLRAAFGPRLAVIENGIDLGRFRPPLPRPELASGSFQRREPGRTRPLRAVYVGRVGPAKRPGLQALYQALGSRSDVCLTFVSTWAPDGRARPTDRVEEALKGADLVFATGRGVREAMACGAIACVLGVWWDGLVCPSSVAELAWYNFSGRARREAPTPFRIAVTVRELLQDSRRLAALRQFSLEYARRHFDLRRSVHETLAFYRSVTREAS